MTICFVQKKWRIFIYNKCNKNMCYDTCLFDITYIDKTYI